ncbi:energy transducer TonB [Luteibacter sp. ME-Dv--P-043b]|uniref:energy transducer TonB n=1 Tax=Luteibacter sp. ME-Dv--P-043b TaxID=3040291 RepID=UPI0025563254|nr:energy transducer TonB [Luteibacter sp. ME-Dv--P-043b]
MSKSSIVAVPRRAIITVAIAVVAMAAASAFTLLQRSHASATSLADVTPSAPVGGAHRSDVDLLLELAREATREGRLIAPQGNNAYEFYLSVLQLDAGNATAHDALRETLPFAAQEIERQINRRELEDARREIALLRDYDATNYTLIILGAKLDAQQQVVVANDEAKADTIRRRNG